MTDPYAAPEWYDPSTLIRRLTGIYAIPINDGLGPLEGEQIIDGVPHFVREFHDNGRALQLVAAGMIQRLEDGELPDTTQIENLIEELKKPADPLGMGRSYIVPIHREAIARLKEFIT